MNDEELLKALILFVGGAKGGVGKTLIAMLVLHYLKEAGLEPILIETDTANPDVYMAYRNACTSHTINIDTDRGFERLIGILEGAKAPVVINSGARNMGTLVRYGEVFNAFERFRTLWVVNHQIDSLKLLKEYLKLVQKPVCVVKNGFFGEEADFDVFDNSELCKRGMPHVYLPQAPSGFTNMLYVERKPISALSEASLGPRLMGAGWLKKALPVIVSALEKAKAFGG